MLLSTEAAAKYLGLKPITLRRWRQTGVGPKYIRMGDDTKSPCRYSMDDLQAWINKRTYHGTAEER